MYRLVAIDVDGTLLDPSHNLTPRNRAAVLSARHRGVIVCLATGKLLASVQPLIRELGIDGMHITCNGAALMDSASAAPAVAWALSPTQQTAALAAVHEADAGIPVAWYTSDAIFTDAMPGILDTTLAAYHEPAVRHVTTLDNRLPPPLKFLMTGDETRLLALRDTLLKLIGADMTVVRTTSDFVEIMAPGVSKGVALRELARRLSIAPEEIVAIGDGENDISLIEAAGLGIAMGNAMPALRERASQLTLSNSEDGVADALERLGLA
jgi:Cof subfamily protein (haloacid dehalogenase superfamily)